MIQQAVTPLAASLQPSTAKVSGADFRLGDEEDLSELKEQAEHSTAMHGPGCRIDYESFCRQKPKKRISKTCFRI